MSDGSARGSTPLDVFVIGGGINGCGIARDAAGRGYSVMLAEMNDLASGTSSWSTKLIHGGLRYLEHYEFRLVREALMEREVLWGMAPHIIWPLRFVLPHHKGIRPAWLIRLGLFLYDHIGGRKALPATRVLDLTRDEAGQAIKPQFRKAFEYSDCWVNDARLVVLNAMDARARGADIRTRCTVTRLERDGALWRVTVEDRDTGQRDTLMARLVVNAAGPWVDKVLTGALAKNDARNVRLVQGSHIVVKKKFAHDRAYFFQNGDGRIFFAIPYEGEFTLIGTTDQDYAGDPGKVAITDKEIDYLIAGAGEYFREPVRRDDIVWTYSGVRPLYDDGASAAQEATRDYVLKVDGERDAAPLVNIFGGKITTYRRLAESMLEKIEGLIGAKGPRWTGGATLPGGDFKAAEFDRLASDIADRLDIAMAEAIRLARLYGTRALAFASPGSGLGLAFGHGLTEAEVSYLMDDEWAVEADDILWRRTKLGLKFSASERERLAAYMQSRRAGPKKKKVAAR